MTLSLSTKIVGLLAGGTFNLAYMTPDDPTNSVARFFPSNLLINPNSLTPVNPATDDTLAEAVTALTGTLIVSDENNAAFTKAPTMTSGQTYPPGRSIGVACTTAGNIALTLSGGGVVELPVTQGWQIFPFAATAFAFGGGAAGTVSNLS